MSRYNKPLPPYSGEQTRCPKCDHHSLFVNESTAGTEYIPTGPLALTEYLLRTCERCGYQWAEATA